MQSTTTLMTLTGAYEKRMQLEAELKAAWPVGTAITAAAWRLEGRLIRLDEMIETMEKHPANRAKVVPVTATLS